MDANIERVLIYRMGSLGDTVVALPCFHQIARAFPNAERLLLSNIPVHSKAPAAYAVLEGSGLVHGYMRYPVATRNVAELLALQREIRSFRPSVLVYLTPRRAAGDVLRDAAFFRLCGVPRTIGLPLARDARANRVDAATGEVEPEAARLARLMRELGTIDLEERSNWDLRLTVEEHRRAATALEPVQGRPLLGLAIGTKMQAKDWGAENWRTLLALLSRHYPGHGLALVGAAEDADAAHLAAAEWQGPVAQLCGLLSPRQTAAVMERGRLFLGPDSGPMHLAAAVGTPAVIAFSARGLPGIWFPIGPRHQVIYHQTSCFGCELETCTVQQRRCLLSITPQQMLDACRRVLGSHS